MEKLFRISLFISGVINFIPSILAFLPQRLANSYGIELSNANFELLLRHRAVLFGIIGGVMIYAAISKKYYRISVSMGLISMISFVVLFMSIQKINAELETVMKLDVLAIFILLVGMILYKFKK